MCCRGGRTISTRSPSCFPITCSPTSGCSPATTNASTDCARRADALSLGAAAMAGTPFPIDREFVRQELGFAAICENSMDAVADRDFAVEFCAAASLAMMHLVAACGRNRAVEYARIRFRGVGRRRDDRFQRLCRKRKTQTWRN